MHATLLWDVPSVMFNALSFAIVRTYAIVSILGADDARLLLTALQPSMSRILCGTKELQSDTVSKRYIDVRGFPVSLSSFVARTFSFESRHLPRIGSLPYYVPNDRQPSSLVRTPF